LKKTIEPLQHLRPWRRVAPAKSGVDLFLEPFLGLLGRLGIEQTMPFANMPDPTEGEAQKVERLFPDITEARLRWV
jgi:hypothetical protein